MSEQTPRGGLPLVLLAGDHQEDTHWLRGLLEPAGYAVLREPSGRYALERARGTEPDVIIVDADLPDMPGVELCRLLRADPRVLSSTPLLLAFRDHASREQRIAALRAGAWECIAPPHEADEILLKIGAYVRAKLDADRARAEGLLDPMTGLYNRQGLARRARELGSQAFREQGTDQRHRSLGDRLSGAPPSAAARALRLRGRRQRRLRADRARRSAGPGVHRLAHRARGKRQLAAPLRRRRQRLSSLNHERLF